MRPYNSRRSGRVVEAALRGSQGIPRAVSEKLNDGFEVRTPIGTSYIVRKQGFQIRGPWYQSTVWIVDLRSLKDARAGREARSKTRCAWTRAFGSWPGPACSVQDGEDQDEDDEEDEQVLRVAYFEKTGCRLACQALRISMCEVAGPLMQCATS